MVDTPTYDATVIGAGLGGLTAAACLAHDGLRVCLIERHATLGGCASTYRTRTGLTIEAALHQTADPHDAHDPKHAVLKRLGVLDAIDWVPVGPVYDVRGGPLGDEPFVLERGFAAAREACRVRFPDAANGMHRVLESMESITNTLGHFTIARDARSLPALARGIVGAGPLIGDWRKSVSEVLYRELGSNEAAKCALAANLPYYADDPSTLWWLYFAVAQGGFIQSGGTFIKGGSSQLVARLAAVVTGAGGRILTGRSACGIDMNAAGYPTGIRHRDAHGGDNQDRVATRLVLANCAPDAAAGMLPDEHRSRLNAAYAGLKPSATVFSIHFGLKKPLPASWPVVYSSVHLPQWMTTLSDYGRASHLLGAAPNGRLPPLAVVHYDAIASGLGDDQTALVTATGLDRLDNWRNLSPAAEQERRHAWTETLTEWLAHEYPGFADAITTTSFMSARSIHDYIGTPDGAIYGFAMPPPRTPPWFGIGRSPKTAVPGLFLASAFAQSGGFSGAIGAGASAATMAARWLRGIEHH